MILIIFKSSFNEVIPLPAFTTPHPHIFLWIALSIIVEADAIVANGAKTFLAKGPAFINGSRNVPNKALRNSHDWMILENCALLSFISVNILLAFLIFVF